MQCDEVLEDELSKLRDFVVSIEDFRIGHVIGRGGFGEVHHAVHLSSGTMCAVKRLNMETLKGHDLKMFLREVQTLVSCQNQFILPLLGFTDTQPFTIITEYMSHGNLQKVLQSRKFVLSRTQLTLIAFGVADGMRVLHQNNIIHRDLKSENVLLDDRFLPRICDFGVARFKAKPDEVVTKTIGTLNWMAPEVFVSPSYTEKVDVYSYGLLLWSLLTKESPWSTLDRSKIMEYVVRENRRPPIPLDTPRALKSLIERCWHENPHERPSFSEICRLFRAGKILYPGTERMRFLERLEKLEHLKTSDFHSPLKRRNIGGLEDSGMNLSLSISPPSQEPSSFLQLPLPPPVPTVKPNLERAKTCEESELFELFPELSQYEQPDISPFQNSQILPFVLLHLYEDETLIPSFAERGLLGCLDFRYAESFHIIDRVLKRSIDFFPLIDWERMFIERSNCEAILHVFSLMTDLFVNASDGPFYLLYNNYEYFIDIGQVESLLRILLELRIKDERNVETIDRILESMLYTNDLSVLELAVRALCTLDDLNFISSEIVFYHFVRHNEDGKMFSVALRRDPEPSLLPFIKPVFATNEQAQLLMCEIATVKEGRQALVGDSLWMTAPNSMPIIITLVQDPECAAILKDNCSLSSKLFDVVMNGPSNEDMELVAHTLFLCHFSYNQTATVGSHDFVWRFIEWSLTVTNTIVISVAMSVIVEMTQAIYVDDVVNLTPRIVELWDSLDKEVCLKFLALVMVKPYLKPALLESGFLETLKTDTTIEARVEPLRQSVIALLETPSE